MNTSRIVMYPAEGNPNAAKNKPWTFVIRGGNGMAIAWGRDYSTHSGCKEGIKALRNIIFSARIVESSP